MKLSLRCHVLGYARLFSQNIGQGQHFSLLQQYLLALVSNWIRQMKVSLAHQHTDTHRWKYADVASQQLYGQHSDQHWVTTTQILHRQRDRQDHLHERIQAYAWRQTAKLDHL